VSHDSPPPYRRQPSAAPRSAMRKDVAGILIDCAFDDINHAEAEKRLRALGLTPAETAAAMKALATMGSGVTL